jgi:putative cardiolipin synthase
VCQKFALDFAIQSRMKNFTALNRLLGSSVVQRFDSDARNRVAAATVAVIASAILLLPGVSNAQANSEALDSDKIVKLSEEAFSAYELKQASLMHDPRAEDWPYYATVNTPHKLRIVEDGLMSLEMRLRMIESAKTSINFMTYATKLDSTGRLLAKALMDAARRGVRVHILLDWYLNGSMESTFVAGQNQMVKEGVSPDHFSVRYYNKGSIARDPVKATHRNHAKLLIVDGHEVMMGGRNSENDYFQITGTQLKFIDRDVWVRSESVDPHASVPLQADAAFDGYWTNKDWVMGPDGKSTATLANLITPALHEADVQLRKQIVSATEATIRLNALREVRGLTFVLDRPGHKLTDRRVTPAIHWRLAATNKDVVIENFATPLLDTKVGILGYLSERRNVPITILTNSSLVSDDPTLSSLGIKSNASLLKQFKNVWLFYMSGKAIFGMNEIRNPDDTGKYATHAKTTVLFSDKKVTTMIGSYNFDGRSELVNCESLLIIENDAQIGFDVASAIQYRALQVLPAVLDKAGRLFYFRPDAVSLPMGGTPLEAATHLLGLHDLLMKEY